jgi:phosphoglucosamine mutase
VQAAVQAVAQELGDTGRILVRASGTENLLRVMVEGKQQEQIERLANQIADVVKAVMG